MKKPARYSPAGIFSICVPDDVSALAIGSIFSSVAQRIGPRLGEGVRHGETEGAVRHHGTVILPWYLPGSFATMSARLFNPVGFSVINAVL